MTKRELEDRGYTFVEWLVSRAELSRTKINNQDALCFELVCWAPLLDDPISFLNDVYVEDRFVSDIIFYMLEASDERSFGDLQNSEVIVAFHKDDLEHADGYDRCYKFYVKTSYEGEEEYVNFYESYNSYCDEEVK